MVDVAVAIDITGLSFRYPDGTLALGGLDLTVQAGERLALIGPNGAGKSTLMLHLNGLLRGSGSISILGMQLGERTLKDIRRRVGLVFQNPDDQLFMPTVFDEVAFAAVNAGHPEDEVRRRVSESLAAVGMSGAEHKSPADLSLGQKKRIAIASVLVTDNEILVLDEPSAGLDPRGRRDLMALLDGFTSTMLIATHDLDLAAHICTCVAVMAGGRILRVGPPAEMLADVTFLRDAGL